MSAWGRTGRVSVTRDNCVKVGFRKVGVVFKSNDKPGMWAAGLLVGGGPAHLPTRDAAVLWVLRRVDPALWRQERGEVWRVRTYKYARGWHAIDPEDGQCQGCLRDFPSTIARAHDLATRRAATR